MIDGLICVIERGQHLNIYHVGNPEELTVAEVAHHVVACLGREAKLLTTPLPEGSTLRRCPNIDKLRALGFAPKIPFVEGIGPVVAWYRDNAHLQPRKAA
jgi:dTDP-glucose 4,6-dehydratase/UDP-glucose 4-epimerase